MQQQLSLSYLLSPRAEPLVNDLDGVVNLRDAMRALVHHAISTLAQDATLVKRVLIVKVGRAQRAGQGATAARGATRGTDVDGR